MNYIECQFVIEPFQPFNEILVAQLSDLQFESFVEEENDQLLKAYIEEGLFSENEVVALLEGLKELATIHFTFQSIEKENWNKKWEENFDPVEVGDFCRIRAPFHESKSNFQYEILIEPKMSFGTGHHQTTQMMMELMKSIDFKNKAVMDMGSGTGVLAILAKKMGAETVKAIDIEEWAYENMQENFQRNEVEVDAYLGDGSLLDGQANKYEVFLANINKNILLSDFDKYHQVLKEEGYLLLSGFYESDEADILASKSLQNYTKVAKLVKEGWCALCIRKG